jgi:imidazolonepropionase-like amidohydrolase
VFYTADGRLRKEKPAHVDTIIDLTGGFVIPPFGEAHNHNVEGRWNIDSVIQTYLQAGVFYVKNPNNIPDFSDQIRDKINRPTSIDVVFANGGLTASGGHPSGLYEHMLRTLRYEPAVGPLPEGWFNGRAFFLIDTEADLQEKWPQILARKPDFIKTYLADAEDFEKNRDNLDPQVRTGLNPTLLPVIVAQAHAEGLRVTTHVETAMDFHYAVAAGVDEIAHLPGFFLQSPEHASRAQIAEEDATRASAQGITVVTTTRLSHTWHGGAQAHGSGPAHANEQLVAIVEEYQKRNLRLLHGHGVTLAIGSDHDETSLPEAMNLLRLGVFDHLTLLKMWAETTPQAIFPNRAIGALEEGREASFLVLACNPITDFSCVENIQLRVKQGYILNQTK